MKKLIFFGLIFLTACSSESLHTGRADIISTQGDEKVKGTVMFTETAEGLKVVADVEGLPPGKHAFHIHEFGAIADQGKAAGGHYNPENTKHGFIVKDGFQNAHAGDFGNIEIDKNGKGSLTLMVPKLRLTEGKYPIAGRAVIIHEKEDDFGQPTGNAGGRIAGGTIMITGIQERR